MAKGKVSKVKRPTWALWVSAIAVVVFIVTGLLYTSLNVQKLATTGYGIETYYDTPQKVLLRWTGVNANQPQEFLFLTANYEDMPFYRITYVPLENMAEVNLSVERLAGKPSGLPDPPLKHVERYFSITPAKAYNVKDVMVRFIVNTSWLSANGVAANKIVFYRFTGERWEKLETTIAWQVPDRVGYDSPLHSFSYFAIGEQAPCTGAVKLALPATAVEKGSVTAAVSGLSYCTGLSVSVKQDSCNGTEVCKLALTDGSGSCDFMAPSVAGSQAYAACIDLNGDTDYKDAGESGTASLAVTAVCPEETRPDVMEGICTAGKQKITDWTCDNSTGKWKELVTTKDCAVCGDGICGAALGETSSTCCADCGCKAGNECRNNACVSLEPEARAAITAANATIAAAGAEDKNITAAQTVLNEAKMAYTAGDYAIAKSKAELANTMALVAPKIERSFAELPLLVMVIAALVAIGGLVYYFKFKPKTGRAVTLPAPTE